MVSYDSIPDFGFLYDSVPLYAARGDVGFYVAESRRTQGRILEVGCGTGRVLLPLAGTGARITGQAELEHLLARAGFRVQAVYGDFDRSPLADDSPEQIICADLH